MLQRHQIDVYSLKNSVRVGETEIKEGASFIVPLNQKQYKVIKTIFEKTLNYKDSLFYDITSWTMPLAFGINAGEVFQRQKVCESV